MAERSRVERSGSSIATDPRISARRESSERVLTVLLSFPATLTWLGVLALLFQWASTAGQGQFQPGEEISIERMATVLILSGMFTAVGLSMSVVAWLGKPKPGWQIFSLILGLVFLWAVAGN